MPGVTQLSKRTFIREVVVPAAQEAGVGQKKPKTAYNRGTDYLQMPRVQAAIAERMQANGVSLDLISAKLAEILNADLKMADNGIGVAPADKLKAIDLYFKTTTGYAVNKSVNLHGGSKQVDKFFNPSVFANPGDPELTIDQE
jgi:hypothetical protein